MLEIGGVKEKVLAAYRAGVPEVILPRGNERDLRDVPDDVREATRFHLVDRMDEVLEIALLPKTTKQRRRTPVDPPAPSRLPQAAEGPER